MCGRPPSATGASGSRTSRSRSRRLREAATPLAREVVAKGAEPMPHSGGLRDRLASAKAGVTVNVIAPGPIDTPIHATWADTRDGSSMQIYTQSLKWDERS